MTPGKSADTPYSPLKIGLIVDSVRASKYVYDLAQWGQTQNNLVICDLIIQDKKNSSHVRKNKIKRGFLYVLGKQLFSLIVKFEALLLLSKKNYKDHKKRFNLDTVIKKSTHITPSISKSSLVYRYSDDELEKIKNLNLDVLIRCGSGILQGKILTITRFGILSFHHADNRINRGSPPGFWEVYFKQASTGFIIQQLTKELDGGNVLVRGGIYTRPSYLLNQACVYIKSNFYLKKLLSDIANTQQLPKPFESEPYFNPLFKNPNLFQQLNYIMNMGKRLLNRKTNKLLLKKQYQWSVAYRKHDWKSLAMWKGIKIKNPPNHFLADPFVIRENDTDYCFVEDYDYKTSRGCISVYQLNDTHAEKIGDAIVEPFHMSFPYLFRFNSKLYMCPETSQNKDIRLYECAEFPLKWKLCAVLMPDVSAVDTLIFEHDGLWWMFTNMDPVLMGDYASELFIFYADNPLSDQWTAHPKNPILFEQANARNAGILYDENSIYRVSQKRDYEMYGKNFSIHKISVLNKEEYIEEQHYAIEPNFFPNIKGTHHLHSDGNTSVFDFAEYTRI